MKLTPQEIWEKLADPIQFSALRIKKIRADLVDDYWVMTKYIFKS